MSTADQCPARLSPAASVTGTDMSTLDGLLDNPFWHALQGPQRSLGQVGERAARYHPDISVMAGLESDTPDAWAELGRLMAPGEVSALYGPALLDAPAGWSRLNQFRPIQMVQAKTEPAPRSPDGFVARPITAGDVSAVLELVGLTQPGPFQSRTTEMGLYLGLWDEAASGGPRLAAMAGQRAHLPGACEVSAVCTHPDYRRRGLSRALVSQMAGLIHAAGLVPFLHVAPENAVAQATYLQLGFVPRNDLWISVMRYGAVEQSSEATDGLG